MRLSGKFHVEYTGEADDGHQIHGEFEQEGNDFKEADKEAQRIVGPNVHLASVRMWPADMPKEYAYPGIRPPMVEAPGPAPVPSESTQPTPSAEYLKDSLTPEEAHVAKLLDYIKEVAETTDEPLAAS